MSRLFCRCPNETHLMCAVPGYVTEAGALGCTTTASSALPLSRVRSNATRETSSISSWSGDSANDSSSSSGGSDDKSQFGAGSGLRIGLAAIMRDEPNWREWCGYHWLIGFEPILIIDHESTPPLSLLSPHVSPHSSRGVDEQPGLRRSRLAQFTTVIRSNRSGWFGVQTALHDEVVLPFMHAKRADWLMVLDADEYLNLNDKFNSVQALLGTLLRASPGVLQVGLPRLDFGSSFLEKQSDDNLLMSTFTRSRDRMETTSGIKTLVALHSVARAASAHHWILRGFNDAALWDSGGHRINTSMYQLSQGERLCWREKVEGPGIRGGGGGEVADVGGGGGEDGGRGSSMADDGGGGSGGGGADASAEAVWTCTPALDASGRAASQGLSHVAVAEPLRQSSINEYTLPLLLTPGDAQPHRSRLLNLSYNDPHVLAYVNHYVWQSRDRFLQRKVLRHRFDHQKLEGFDAERAARFHAVANDVDNTVLSNAWAPRVTRLLLCCA